MSRECSSAKAVARLLPLVALLVLLISPAPAQAATPVGARVALLSGSGDGAFDADVRQKLLRTGRFLEVDVIDIVRTTPTRNDLEQYDSVLVYTDCCRPADPVGLGDVLAEYADAGGGVVLSTFSWSGIEGLAVGGRITSPGYRVLSLGSQTQDTPMTLVRDVPGHPLLAGVRSFSGGTSSYHSSPVRVAPGATLVAHWSVDDQPLVVARPAPVGGGSIVGLNFYPASSDAREDLWAAETDGDVLLANALVEAAAPAVPTRKAQCERGGWRDLVDDRGRSFRSQGKCVAFVGQASRGQRPIALDLPDGRATGVRAPLLPA